MGLAVLECKDEVEARALVANDPVIKFGIGFQVEVYPVLRAGLRKSVS